MTAPLKPPTQLSKADFTEMAAIAKARKDNLQTMFNGATIVSGKTSAAGSARSVVSAGKDVFDYAKKLPSAGSSRLPF